MVKQEHDESRKDYLLRVALTFINENQEAAEATVDYDETTCDGYCLAEDIESALADS